MPRSDHPRSSAEVAVAKEEQGRAAIRRAHAAVAALASLSPQDAGLLLRLRSGHRRWRLNTEDWHELAVILCSQKEAACGTIAAPNPRIAALYLRVALRGKLYATQPAARRNPYALAALASGVEALTGAEVTELLQKWNSFDNLAAERALHRVMRYGSLRPPPAAPPTRQTRRFVTGALAQILLERMPSSFTAWAERVATNVDRVPDQRLLVLADALSLPQEVYAKRLSVEVLRLVAPEEVHQDADAMLKEAREVWRPRPRYQWYAGPSGSAVT